MPRVVRIPWVYVLGRWSENGCPGDELFRRGVGKNFLAERLFGKCNVTGGVDEFLELSIGHFVLVDPKARNLNPVGRTFLRIEITVPRWFVVSPEIKPASEQTIPSSSLIFPGGGEGFCRDSKRKGPVPWSKMREEGNHKPRQAKESFVHLKCSRMPKRNVACLAKVD